jgi:molecular chaperone HtpG
MGQTRVDLLHLLEDLRDAYPGSLEETLLTAAINLSVPGRRTRKKPMHLSLKLQFESRLESAEPGRLAENIIWINEAHPAYRRASASRSEGYHIAMSAAMALSTVAVEPREQRAFVNAFLTR